MLQTSKLQTDLPHLDLATLRVYNSLSDKNKKKTHYQQLTTTELVMPMRWDL